MLLDVLVGVAAVGQHASVLVVGHFVPLVGVEVAIDLCGMVGSHVFCWIQIQNINYSNPDSL